MAPSKTGVTPQSRRRLVLALTVGAVIAGVATFMLVSPAPNRRFVKPTSFPIVSTSRPHRGHASSPRTSPAALPAAPSYFFISVNADDPKAVCHARIEEGTRQTQFIPCRFRVPSAKRFQLQVARRGYQPFFQEWRVHEDRSLALEVLQEEKKVVLAGDPTSPDAGHSPSTKSSASASLMKSRKKYTVATKPNQKKRGSAEGDPNQNPINHTPTKMFPPQPEGQPPKEVLGEGTVGF